MSHATLTVEDRVCELVFLAQADEPPSARSHGARFLLHVADRVRVALTEGPLTDDGTVTKFAREMQPVWPEDTWRVFVDLRAWAEGDAVALALRAGAHDGGFTDAANHALALIAERLIRALVAQEAGAR